MTVNPTLVFATRNQGKVVELRQLLAGLPLTICSLHELERSRGPMAEVDEDADTFRGNAIKKARQVSQQTGLAALADDSGLCVDALDGAPGVHSARYAGPDATDDDNNRKLLDNLQAVPDDERGARFCSVLALADCGGELGTEVLTSEGVCHGVILRAPRGDGGFGYDPLFLLPDLNATFAELGVGTKNDRSHRACAMRAMRPQLLDYFRLAPGVHSG